MPSFPRRARWIRTIVCLVVLAGRPGLTQEPRRVFPVEPSHRAVVGARPIFHVGYEGLDDATLREQRFRIELRASSRGIESLDFNQKRQASGWTRGEPGLMLYRPQLPIPDGSYAWSVALWDGVSWIQGRESFEIRVDSVPPAPVEGLRVRYDRERSAVELRWEPVVQDVDGGAEFVARYHVYRYPQPDRTPPVRPYEVLRTDQTSAVLEPDGPDDEKSWYYRVTAEDLAGNEAGRPD